MRQRRSAARFVRIVQLAHRQQFVHQRLEFGQVAFHGLDALSELRVLGTLGQKFQRELQPGDRRAQFVRHRMQQVLLRFQQGLDTLGHRVHAPGQRIHGT